MVGVEVVVDRRRQEVKDDSDDDSVVGVEEVERWMWTRRLRTCCTFYRRENI